MQKLKKVFKKRPFICTSIFCLVIGYLLAPLSIFISEYFKIVPFIIFLVWLFIFIPIKFFKTKGKFSKKISGILPKTDGQWFFLFFIVLFALAVGFFGFFSPWYFGKEARKNATSTMHKFTVKYIDDETRKCSAGESSIMNNTLNCSNINSKNIIQATIDAMTDKNVWQHGKPVHNNAVRSSSSNTNDEDVGYVSLSASGSDIIIKTCNKTPCREKENRLQASIGIE